MAEDCRAYGEVLDRSYRSGQITIRPYMWRVGTHLAAGEAKPSGEMTLAREIDSLNVGRRTIDELTWSMEHEAVHIAFRISSGPQDNEDAVDARVRSCRSWPGPFPLGAGAEVTAGRYRGGLPWSAAIACCNSSECPATRVTLNTLRTMPPASITNVVRTIPMYETPKSFFFPQTPYRPAPRGPGRTAA